MSFKMICNGCGAPSGPSVGVCPYCKSIQTTDSAEQSPGAHAFQKLFREGKLEQALSLGNEIMKADAQMKKDASFVLSFVQVLLEAEAPSSRIRSLLAEAQLHSPHNTEISDYLELLEARGLLKHGRNDAGEIMIRNLLRRSPRNAYAHFFLGSHIFWTDADPVSAIPHLEMTVKLHPNFLRAWGCLGVLYRRIGNAPLAQSAFQRCIDLETQPQMKIYFEEQIQSLARAA